MKESSNMLSTLVSVVQVQLEDTKKAREDAYEKYVASRLGFYTSSQYSSVFKDIMFQSKKNHFSTAETATSQSTRTN